LGFLSGLTGTGGGIFLTPLLLFCEWSTIRQAAAASAFFILVNSIGGLIGYFTATRSLPMLGIYLAIPAIVGGGIGSYLGSRRLPPRGIAIFLAIVLTIAGCKLIFTR
ncbi:MAG TPA: TSUP family transporter, partial [Chthoniobacterales bacterium]|nr:TSUP family transporter [Chthoniobacterales bacterium]